jgi:catechol 2,3-dioxygenase-like lactoylglutathione lyase family enzyme
MDVSDRSVGRREFLTISAAAFLAAHVRPSAGEPVSRNAIGGAPRISALELLTAAPLSAMKTFYSGALGLRTVDERTNRLTIAAGTTRLTFLPGTPADGQPFYHFAFNIPENKILSALAWQKARSPLLPIPPRNRAAGYPDEVVDYSHWNAHSIFFLDPGGNVVEYIARHDLSNSAAGVFGPEDILYASEIAFVVDDVRSAAAALKPAAGIEQYRGGDEQFMALGDEAGLLLIMKRGRILNFDPSTREKAAGVFPTRAAVRGPVGGEHKWTGFPYSVTVVDSR